MRKVKLEVLEKMTYKRDIVVEVPDSMSDSVLEKALDEAQREESLSDFIHVLGERGVALHGGYDEDLSSPWNLEVECDSYEDVQEE